MRTTKYASGALHATTVEYDFCKRQKGDREIGATGDTFMYIPAMYNACLAMVVQGGDFLH